MTKSPPRPEEPAKLGESEFSRLRDLIRLSSGIALSGDKRQLVESRLSPRLRDLGLTSYAEYCDLVLEPGSVEAGHMVNAVTTNLTSFLRERHHFETLRRWLDERGDSAPPARIWSAACSTGEEPYSIAIASVMAGWLATRVLATDIDTRVLAAAREGVYRQNAIQGMPLPWQRRAFLRGKDEGRGWVRVKDDVREMVRFAPMNLASAEWPRMRPMDAIFCRNVLIYFDAPTQRAVVDKLAGNLAPGGLLFLGHAESQAGHHEMLEPAGVTTYRRRAVAAVAFAEAGDSGEAGKYE